MKARICLITISLLSVYTACYNLSTITGYVYDYDTGKPVKGAVVRFHYNCEAPCKGKSDIMDISDHNGRYKVNIKEEGLLTGNYSSVEVKKEGYLPFYDDLKSTKDHELSIYLKEAPSKKL